MSEIRTELRRLLKTAERRAEGSNTKYAAACREVAAHYRAALAELDAASAKWSAMLRSLTAVEPAPSPDIAPREEPAEPDGCREPGEYDAVSCAKVHSSCPYHPETGRRAAPAPSRAQACPDDSLPLCACGHCEGEHGQGCFGNRPCLDRDCKCTDFRAAPSGPREGT